MTDGVRQKVRRFDVGHHRFDGHPLASRGRVGIDGYCKRTSRRVRIEALTTDATREQEVRFTRQVQCLSLVEHPCVQRILDAGILADAESEALGASAGSPYFVTEVPAGWSLVENPDPRNATEAGRLIGGILDGLRAVHAAGFVHADLRPDNITRGGVESNGYGIQITGFEAVVSIEDAERPWPPVDPDPRYSAPEQRASPPEPVGPWTDLYALGRVVSDFCSADIEDFAAARLDSALRPLRPRFSLPARAYLWISNMTCVDATTRYRDAWTGAADPRSGLGKHPDGFAADHGWACVGDTAPRRTLANVRVGTLIDSGAVQKLGLREPWEPEGHGSQAAASDSTIGRDE